MILTHLLAGFIGAGLGALWRTRKAPDPKTEARQESKIRSVIEYRAAIHEAGHAVCTWFSPHTHSLDRITIDDGAIGAGRVAHSTRGSGPSHDWSLLQIHLGGIAAELSEFGKVRSGPAGVDLIRVRDRAANLARYSMPSCPWSEDQLSDSEFDVTAMLHHIEPDSDQGIVINLAYRRARFLVDKDRDRLLKVADALAEKGVLEKAEIREIFGKRWRWPW